jgi:hypothetical protein
MRRWMLAALAGAALMTAAMPARAAWKTYVNRDLGFSFMAPGDVKTSEGTFRGQESGPRQTIIYRSMEDNIEYKVTVMSFMQAQAESAVILGEREWMFTNRRNVLMDAFGRVEPGKDSVYGRKIVVELPDNKGRVTAAFYFNKGKQITLEATVLPAHGDYGSAEPSRFIDSLVFNLSRTEPGAIALKTPELD